LAWVFVSRRLKLRKSLLIKTGSRICKDEFLNLRGLRLSAAVKERLSKEITSWDHRAEDLKLQEQAGRPNARLNSQEARRRADELQSRLQKRMAQLDLEAQIAPLPPVVVGGLLVVPVGLLSTLTGRPLPTTAQAIDTQAAAARARAIVMEVERSLGYEPVDRELEHLGYDIESRDPATGRLRFIEVKGRAGVDEVALTANEYKTAERLGEDYWLYVVYHCATTPQLHRIPNPSRLGWQPVTKVEHYRVEAEEIVSWSDDEDEG
jgi:hypothetical protein